MIVDHDHKMQGHASIYQLKQKCHIGAQHKYVLIMYSKHPVQLHTKNMNTLTLVIH